MRRITFSRNYTLSLSRTCRCYCKYCAFATHQAHVYSPDEVDEQLEQAVRRNAKELLILTGEMPEVNPIVAEKLASWGHDDFTSYVVWACERAMERGMLPHTNIGVLSRADQARLREVTASQGLMLESVSERLMETVHAGSPTKHPAVRIEAIETAGELQIPFTSGILVGVGETEQERFDSLDELGPDPRAPRPHPGGDPAELRAAPRLLRARAGRDRRCRFAGALVAGGVGARGRGGRRRLDAAARLGLAGDARRHEGARRLRARRDARASGSRSRRT